MKEFIFNNEGKLKKLQDDAKIAQVSACVPDLHEEEGIGFRKATWGPVLHWNAESEEEERILEILSLGNCAKSGQGGKGVGTF